MGGWSFVSNNRVSKLVEKIRGLQRNRTKRMCVHRQKERGTDREGGKEEEEAKEGEGGTEIYF